jgi:hypothetical protein
MTDWQLRIRRRVVADTWLTVSRVAFSHSDIQELWKTQTLIVGRRLAL